MKTLYKIVALVGVSTMATSCFNKEKPNYQLFPDMYESVAYETYAESDAFNNGITAQKPAEGTIPRGFEPEGYDNTPEGLELARVELKSPLRSEEHTSELQSRPHLVCRLLLEKKKKKKIKKKHCI